jgi:hypothetical protein
MRVTLSLRSLWLCGPRFSAQARVTRADLSVGRLPLIHKQLGIYPPFGFVLRVGTAFQGSSGQGCFG